MFEPESDPESETDRDGPDPPSQTRLEQAVSQWKVLILYSSYISDVMLELHHLSTTSLFR